MKRSFVLTVAAAVLVLGVSALEARAGQVVLPAPLSDLLPAGRFALVSAPNETETFSDFAFSASPVGSPPAAADITVREFHAGLEAGLSFSGALFAAAGTVVDYSIFFTVTAPRGFVIDDATLSGVFSNFGGTGSGTVGETLL